MVAARQGTAPAPLPPCATGRLSPVAPCAPLPPSRPQGPPERRRRTLPARPGRPRPVSRVPRARATAGLEAAPLRDGRRAQPTAGPDVTPSPFAG